MESRGQSELANTMPLRERVPFMRRHNKSWMVTQNGVTAKRASHLLTLFFPLDAGSPRKVPSAILTLRTSVVLH